MELPTTTEASQIQMDYMKLLVTQLQNQNPLEPMDNEQMAAQLAQFSELEQLESMNSRFTDVLQSVESAYANSLIGKQVTFAVENENNTESVSGIVEEIHNEAEGNINLTIGDYTIGLHDVLSVKNS
jgi:flagellar basal-body rod modification protein FlgD